MNITEEQAREKWCPAVRITITRDGKNGTTRMSGGGTNCIASDCMWWRWRKPYVAGDGHHFGGQDKIGYCGMAGKL